jgi:hypothetical protein
VVIVRPARLAREAVILQPGVGIHFAIILDDVVGRTETPMGARIVHVAHKRFRSWPLGAKAALFPTVAPTVMQITCTVLGVCPFVPPPPPTH